MSNIHADEFFKDAAINADDQPVKADALFGSVESVAPATPLEGAGSEAEKADLLDMEGLDSASVGAVEVEGVFSSAETVQQESTLPEPPQLSDLQPITIQEFAVDLSSFQPVSVDDVVDEADQHECSSVSVIQPIDSVEEPIETADVPASDQIADAPAANSLPYAEVLPEIKLIPDFGFEPGLDTVEMDEPEPTPCVEEIAFDGRFVSEVDPVFQDDLVGTSSTLPPMTTLAFGVNEASKSSSLLFGEEQGGKPIGRSFMQNRELSWLTFDERVLDQGADESVPLLERLNFISIFWSNLQEFFMVRVGSLTDLSLIEPPVIDSKSGMSADEQIKAIHERCRELYPIQESYYEHVRGSLSKEGVRHLRPDDLSDEQRNYLSGFVKFNVEPFLSPQIINPLHPFPHLENGKLYILVRLDDEAAPAKDKKEKKGKKKKKGKGGAEGVVLGLIPLPHQCDRIIKVPGRGFQFVLLEHAIEMFASEIFSMYKIKHTNVICVTRNADIDANQTGDEQDEDYREHMRRMLRKRARLAPVRLECERPLSPVLQKLMLKKLGLKKSQVYDTTVPLDLSFTWELGGRLSESKRAKLSNPPFTPAWSASFDRNRRILDQVNDRDILLSYPYESMEPFIQMLKEAATDPSVVSIKITLYRLARQSQLAEALIAAAENGKEVTALFELRARFDESNNIEWSQRFEQAGCNVIYGFRDYKVHSKICCITRQTENGLECITQLGTGNYNEKTAALYTDFSFITKSEAFGRDATEFFRNMQLENVSDNYEVLRVAPLQIKSMILENLDRQIVLARQGKPCGAFLKANSITDKDVIEKIAEASCAGVGITLFVRGICCIVPEVKGATENVRVVSIVGRLLEHSRIYCFGTPSDCRMYLSSADLMTRNLNKRIEIAWPILSEEIRWRILDYIDICLKDTAKLRELRPNATYTPLGAFCDIDEDGNSQPMFDSQAALIERAIAQMVELDEVESKEEKPLPDVEQAGDVVELDAELPNGEAVLIDAPDLVSVEGSAQEDAQAPELDFDPEAESAEDDGECETAVESEVVTDSEPESCLEPEPALDLESEVESEAESEADSDPEVESEPAIESLDFMQFEVVPTALPEGLEPPKMEAAADEPEGNLTFDGSAEELAVESVDVVPEADGKPELSLSDFNPVLDEIAPITLEVELDDDFLVDLDTAQLEQVDAPTSDEAEAQVPLTEMTLEEILVDLPCVQPVEAEAAQAQPVVEQASVLSPENDVRAVRVSAPSAEAQQSSEPQEKPKGEQFTINGLPPEIMEHIINKEQIIAAQANSLADDSSNFFDEQVKTIEMPPEKKGLFSRRKK